VQNAVTSVQEIFEGPGRVVFTTAWICSLYEINALYAKMFSFLFLMVTWIQCPIATHAATTGHLHRWKLKFSSIQLFTFLYRKNHAVYFVEICTDDVNWIVIKLILHTANKCTIFEVSSFRYFMWLKFLNVSRDTDHVHLVDS